MFICSALLLCFENCIEAKFIFLSFSEMKCIKHQSWFLYVNKKYIWMRVESLKIWFKGKFYYFYKVFYKYVSRGEHQTHSETMLILHRDQKTDVCCLLLGIRDFYISIISTFGWYQYQIHNHPIVSFIKIPVLVWSKMFLGKTLLTSTPSQCTSLRHFSSAPTTMPDIELKKLARTPLWCTAAASAISIIMNLSMCNAPFTVN